MSKWLWQRRLRMCFFRRAENVRRLAHLKLQESVMTGLWRNLFWLNRPSWRNFRGVFPRKVRHTKTDRFFWHVNSRHWWILTNFCQKSVQCKKLYYPVYSFSKILTKWIVYSANLILTSDCTFPSFKVKVPLINNVFEMGQINSHALKKILL